MHASVSEILSTPAVLPLRATRDLSDEHRGEIAVLDHTGDTKLVWDRRNAPEVEAARATFDALKRQGYLAYSVSKAGDRNEVLREFDPDAEAIILSPPLAGG